MNHSNSPVVFRRINGRIIPIRRSGEGNKKEFAKGTAIAASGVVVAGAGGRAYKKAIFASANTAFKAFESIGSIFKKSVKAQAQGDLFEFAADANKNDQAFKMFRKANRFASAGTFLKRISIPAGAALITVGALKSLNSLDQKNKKKINPALVAGGGAGAAILAPKAYQYSKLAFDKLGTGGKQGAFDFAKHNYEWAAPYAKEAFSKLFKAKL